MPRAKKPWFRVYTEMVRDRKLLRLTPAQRWLWIVILASARESPEAGWLMLSEKEPLSAGDLSDASGLRAPEVTKTMATMELLQMVEWADDVGAWFVPSFLERQYESDFKPHH